MCRNGRTRLFPYYYQVAGLGELLTPFGFCFTVSFSDKGRPQKTPTSSPSSGSQKMLQLDSAGNTAERVKSPAGFSGGSTPGLKPNVTFPDGGLGTSRSAAGAASASGECL